MPSTYLPKSVRDRTFKNGDFYEPDVLFLVGMYATSGVFTDDGTSITYEYAKELRKQGKRVAFIGVGGKTYTDKERGHYVHPWHFQYTLDESKTRYLSKNNLFVSDSPYEYLTLYANADKVYTDMVHATITSLVYGTPVKYYRIDNRRNAFESLSYIHKDEDGFLYVDKKLLDMEKRQIEDYVMNRMEQMI